MGPSLLRPILVRAASLGAVLIIVLVLLVLTLGVTGYSDRILSAQVGEELRALRTSLSQTITDPDAVEEAIAARRAELEASFGLDQPWYERLPGRRRAGADVRPRRGALDPQLRGQQHRLGHRHRAPPEHDAPADDLAHHHRRSSACRSGSGCPRGRARAPTASCPTSPRSRTGCPRWWTGILLILVFGFWLRVLPSGGMFSAPPPDGRDRALPRPAVARGPADPDARARERRARRST